MKETILAAFDEVGGKDFLVQVAKSDPRVVCSIMGKLVAAEVKAELEHSESRWSSLAIKQG